MVIHIRGVSGRVAGRRLPVDGFAAAALTNVGGMSAAERGQRALGKGKACATVCGSERHDVGQRCQRRYLHSAAVAGYTA
eukprot:640538-Pleurochrysis_carterae.AAC.1